MLLKRLFSMALLLSVAGTTFVMSEQDAEARCCRQRCHRRRCCNNGCYGNGYGYSNYGYSGYSNCNSCSTTTVNGTIAPQPYDGNPPAPAAATPAPPPAPST